ncbi:uncharacterized protein LOC130614788 [Hydractinia symbiolongicarpus]|uniref:uncharacterized protein LOC130614788 n=1 Tax=Hydractinia symbiolongicarpus TaxID=13093 RepID=UPI002551B5AA|nr:uncharacterized protein LOC130614788 [Hydractinia symbiolongicarpus]
MMEELIESYFLDGYTNVEILGFLAIQHNIYISVSTLKRRLKEKNLRRSISKQNEDRAAIGAEVARQLFGSGSNLGYRKIWSILKKMGIVVNRNTVMKIVRELDPEGVSTRKKKRLRRRIYSVPGPGFLWHIDGYDKLKPYGFSILGCIDGFSRKIIWMKVSPSNKDPNIIAAYFLLAVKENAAVPTKIRSDDGTENSLIEPIQITLRAEHDDEFAGLASYVIGTSPSKSAH